MTYNLVAIKIDARENCATSVQGILTRYGCNIKVRLGLHDLPADACSSSGLIILEVVGDEVPEMVGALKAVDGVTVEQITL